jgi:hypothetical protein
MSTAETVEWLDDLERRFAATGEPVVERRIALAGGALTLRAAGPRMLDTLAPAFAHLPEPDPDADLPSLVVNIWDSHAGPESRPPLPDAQGEPRGATFYHEEGPVQIASQPGLHLLSALDSSAGEAWFWTESADTLPFWESAAPFRQILHWWLGGRGIGLLHGASVGTETGGVLLVGRGGSGKSTSALSCLASNLLYAADDYVAVEQGEVPQVHSLYSSGKLEPAHATRLSHLSLPALGGAEDEKVVFYIHDRYPERTCEGFPLRAVFAPRITGGDARVVPLPAAVALRALAPSTLLQLHPADPEAFASMARLLRTVPAYTLEVGPKIEQIPAAIERFLAEHDGTP